MSSNHEEVGLRSSCIILLYLDGVSVDTALPTNTPEQTNKKMRKRVSALLAQTAAESAGSITLTGGTSIDYTARAEFLPVTTEGFGGALGDPQAAVMATAYVLTPCEAASRPVCFAFNGGPGSASVWLHLGALGPKRVTTPDDGSMPAAPYAVVGNPHSWLEHFDLVFIDPPHTGWSTTASVEARTKMLSVDGDVTALCEVVRVWLTRHKRWGSPVYLAGESYGTTRAAAMADKLQGAGVALSGLILISCAMDLQSIVFAPANDLPHALFLPGFANVSQYHGLLKGALGRSAEDARAAAESFIDEEYTSALAAGHRLDGRRRQRIAKRVAELTGLPQSLVEEKNLRISDSSYFVEALRSQGRNVGRLDARATAPRAASGGRDIEFDPGIEAVAAPYTMAAMAYYADLGMSAEVRYEVFSHDAHKAWNWNRGEDKGNSFASTSPDLARALRRNPYLKVFVASGRYDLGTPYSATDWSLAQLDAPAEVLVRVSHHYYDAGHMMYTREADLAQLKADLGRWLA